VGNAARASAPAGSTGGTGSLTENVIARCAHCR
jgi:hypothetical protein